MIVLNITRYLMMAFGKKTLSKINLTWLTKGSLY